MGKDEAAWVRAKLLETMVRIRQTKLTGRCAICGKPVAHWPDTGEPRMVCNNPRCLYQWLLPGMKEFDAIASDDDDALPTTEHDDEQASTTDPLPQPLPPIPF